MISTEKTNALKVRTFYSIDLSYVTCIMHRRLVWRSRRACLWYYKFDTLLNSIRWPGSGDVISSGKDHRCDIVHESCDLLVHRLTMDFVFDFHWTCRQWVVDIRLCSTKSCPLGLSWKWKVQYLHWGTTKDHYLAINAQCMCRTKEVVILLQSITRFVW